MAEQSIKDLAYRTAAGVLGGPVDIATMFMRPFGFKTPDTDVFGGSEYLGKKMEDVGLISSARSPITEFITSLAVPTPGGVAKGAAIAAPALAGIFVGKGSKTWDVIAATKAKELEAAKVDPKIIWQQTGTWKGPDGKWRQEIDDSAANLQDMAGLLASKRSVAESGTMASKDAKYSPEQMTAFATQKKERDLLRAQESEALRQQEKTLANKNIEQLGTVGTSKFFTPGEIESQKFFYQSGDSAGAQAQGRLNAVNAIERSLIEKNIPIEKVTFSKDGNSKSIYANIDGKTVRISDHYLPETPQRLSNREQGLTGKWEHEVIVGDWRRDLDNYIKEITNFK